MAARGNSGELILNNNNRVKMEGGGREEEGKNSRVSERMIFRCNETVNAIIGKIHLKKVREDKRRYSFQQHEHKTDKKSICIFLKQE